MKVTDKDKSNREKPTEQHIIYRKISGPLKILESLATIFIGAVTIYVMISQRDLQEKTIQMQKNEHQPKFIVDFWESCFKDSTDIKYESFSISNLGEKFIHCDNPKITTYIEVNYTEYRYPKATHCCFHIPYTEYFDIRSTNKLQGEIAVGHESFDVAKHLSELFSTRPKNPISNNAFDFAFQTIHMIQISYQDIYKEHHDVYFKKTDEIEENVFKQYYDDSTLEEGDIFDQSTLKKGSVFNYNIAKLDFEQIFDYISYLKESQTD